MVFPLRSRNPKSMKRRKTKGREGVKPNIIEVLHSVGRYYQYIAYYFFEYYEKATTFVLLTKVHLSIITNKL